jgi:hypothetical protein
MRYTNHRENVADCKTAMARGRREWVTRRRESPNCLLFTLPTELRICIYELVFDNGNETMSNAGFVPFPMKKVGLPSSALIRSCQRFYGETKGMFTAAYSRFWQRSFVIDVWNDPLPYRYRDLISRLRSTPTSSWYERAITLHWRKW